MKGVIDKRIPRYSKLIMPTFTALKELGGSGKNTEMPAARKYYAIHHQKTQSTEKTSFGLA